MVGNTAYQFPDSMSDDEAISVLKQQGVLTPNRTWMDEAGDFLGGLWENVNPVEAVKGLASAAAHPLDTAKGVLEAQDVPRQKAEEAFKRGDYAEGLRHSIGYLLPLIGPAIDKAGNEAASGNLAKGLGEATGIGLNLVAPKYVPKLSAAAKSAGMAGVSKVLPKLTTPVEEAALASVENEVPMTVGQRLGIPALQRAEQSLQNFPGSAARVRKFNVAQEEALANRGEGIVSGAGGESTNAVGAGQAMEQRLKQRINRLKSYADQQYNAVRSQVEKNKMAVQVGTEESPLVDPSGVPYKTPVANVIEAPIDLDKYRPALSTIYEELSRTLPEGRKAYSPSYTALKNVMDSGNRYMGAMDFDKFLGGIKNIARESGDNPYLTNQAQGLARKMISSGEQELQSALEQAGPNVQSQLARGRAAVKAYHEAADVLSDLPTEPASMYNQIMTGGDRSYNTLQTLKRLAPAELRTVGKTFLQQLLDKATAEGGFGRSAGVMQDWMRLGPETKEVLFGKNLTGDLDNFFLAAKRLTASHNPSGTAHMLASLTGLGSVGTALAELFTGHPGASAATVGGTFVGPNLAARFLLNPSNAKLLSRAMTTAPGTAEFSKLATLLNARYLNSAEQPDE